MPGRAGRRILIFSHFFIQGGFLPISAAADLSKKTGFPGLRLPPSFLRCAPERLRRYFNSLSCFSKISQRARHAQIPCLFFTYKFFLFFYYNLLFPVFSLENAKSKIRKHLFFLTVCNNFIMTANCGII